MNVSKLKAISFGVYAFAAGALLLSGCSEAEKSGQGGGAAPQASKAPPPVEVVSVEVKELNWDQSYPGRVEGLRRVTIRPQVSGVILERAYEEGSIVEEDDVLFQIDPAPYEVALKQSKAQLQRAEAGLRQAERNWNRAQTLFSSDALSERQRDDAQSAFELAQADVAVAEAEVADAKLQLDYATVRSPVTGVTGMEQMPQGSLVSVGDPLTIVTQMNPVYVLFSLPEGDPAYSKILAGKGGESQYQLSLSRRNNEPYSAKGTINFRDTRVAEETGTIRVRASFPNPDHEILPGQFVRVSFENMTLDQAAIIPSDAILATPEGSMVYVANDQNQVEIRPVVLGPNLKEGQLVTKGLEDGDRVIASSLIRIGPGMTIKPMEKGSEATTSASEQSQNSNQEGKGGEQ